MIDCPSCVTGQDGWSQPTSLLGLRRASSSFLLTFLSCLICTVAFLPSPMPVFISLTSGSSLSRCSTLCWEMTDKKNTKLFLLSLYPLQEHASALTKDQQLNVCVLQWEDRHLIRHLLYQGTWNRKFFCTEQISLHTEMAAINSEVGITKIYHHHPLPQTVARVCRAKIYCNNL